jgi:integrase
MLKIYRRKGAKNWRVRGTVHGIFIDRTCGTSARKEAAEVAAVIYDRLKLAALHGAGQRGTPFLEVAVRYMQRLAPVEQERVDKLIDYFRDRTIQSITAEDFVKCAEQLYPRVKPQTVMRWCITPLTAVLNDAASYVEGYNPPRVKKDRWRGDNPRTHWLTQEQASQLYECSGPYLQAFIMLCLDCGCRPGEALSLQRRDIVLLPQMPNAGIVRFPRTKNGELRESPVKRPTAERLLALPGVRDRVFWVWQDRWALLKEWHKAREAAGLPPEITPHVLCHTFATWMRLYTRADERALLATKRWKDHRAVQRYMHTAPNEIEDRLQKLPQIRRVV